MRISTMLLAGAAALVLAGGVARAESVLHVPPAEAAAGAPLELSATVSRAWESTLTLHWRPVGAAAWIDAAFTRRDDDAWIAVVPADAVTPPGVEYYIDSRPAADDAAPADGAPAAAAAAPTAEFASAAHPHRVNVLRAVLDERKERQLARSGGRRYHVRAAADYVDYGTRNIPGFGDRVDRYYRVDLGFSYRLLAYPLERIHVGYTRLIGDVPETPRGLPEECTASDGTADCALRVGYKVGGWFGVRLGMGQGVDLDARGMVMATEVGAGLGGALELHVGDDEASHVAFGLEAMQDVGVSGHFRLGWATVPDLPMAATVEVTDLPSSRRATGIRILYDVAYPVSPGVKVGARVGYAARDARVGGFAGGANLTLDF
ncbi:MAG: hypothetical protein H6709_03485 [Kofleriaceae bacterium]|nr:hypothetical protein [Kofleriaceae bacterium]